MEKIKIVYFSTYLLIELYAIKNNPVVKNFINLLGAIATNPDFEANIEAYAVFVSSLKNKDFTYYLKKAYSKCPEVNNPLEYEIIVSLSEVGFEEIKNALIKKYYNYFTLLNKLPAYKNTSFEKFEYKEASKNNRAFVFDTDLELKPIEFSETTTYSDLKGYVNQKRTLYENTKAFLDGAKVNNILLYGDAGCGKSTSVRALLNVFREIKMVQIFKHNLINLDKLYKILGESPYKYIIFADDISFDESDKELSTMKAVLEGSLIQCPKNVVIYATSNRRHLIRESFQSRTGDEIHLKDTLNELSSLSERFGINLLFQKPSNDEFNEIVWQIAQDNDIKMPKEELIARAQKLALVKGSRSPRIARQLIDSIKAGVGV